MRELHDPLRRPQLLSRVVALVALASLAGCAMEPATIYDVSPGAPTAPRYEPAARRAIEYLAETELELGVDVLVALQIYGQRRGDLRAIEVAERRRADVWPSDLERYGVLLEIDKPAFENAVIDVAPSAGPPNPLDELEDDRVTRCLDEALVCEPTPACLDYLELEDRWGYVLTHQAVTLLFLRWTECAVAVDVDARRAVFAANLVAAMQDDPEPSDLAYERMAMLGHLGFADAIEPSWLDAALDAQQPDGCFPLGPGRECHPHSTGVALWALAHAPDR